MITKYKDLCIICGKPKECEHHLIFGRGMRDLADEDGLKVPMCNHCHNMGSGGEVIHGNPMAEKMSKIIGQLCFEKSKVADGMSEEDAREEFRKRYNISYL